LESRRVASEKKIAVLRKQQAEELERHGLLEAARETSSMNSSVCRIREAKKHAMETFPGAPVAKSVNGHYSIEP
jgi:hypothetical protein